MTESDSPGARSQLQDVLVFINNSGKPDLDIGIEGTNLVTNRAMNIWFEAQSHQAKDVIRKLGGVILEQSWFYSGLRAGVPAENLEIHMQTIGAVDNVTGVHFPN
jgi:hypothetical protein